MKVLITHEESQIVTQSFRKRGHEAYSCDLQETRGNPDWHFQTDALFMIKTRQWDLIIMHPVCTALALSGNRWYAQGKGKHHERIEALANINLLWNFALMHSKHVCMENPQGVISTNLPEIPKPQYIQPWQFGHGETKKTGLFLYGLPELIPTNIVDGREQRVWKMGPHPNRARDRAETYQGIADAMADQWG